MTIRLVRIDGVRNLLGQELTPGPTLNFFSGPNGAGKTSVLEAIHILALGRSFRPGRRFAWINREAEAATVFVESENHRLGIRYAPSAWSARIDGQDCGDRAELSERLPVVVFHPESHALVDGEPLHRRRLVDGGVFHVEHTFLRDWRAFRKALQQRNAALRAGATDRQLRAWEREMVTPAERISAARSAYVSALGTALTETLQALDLRLPLLELSFQPGWNTEESLGDALERMRGSDRDRGFTQAGPQRADLRIRDAGGPVSGRFSRGQQKLAALALVLAQAAHHARASERPPVFLFDDLGSELDMDHERRVGTHLAGSGWQIWMTGVEPSRWLAERGGVRAFHVEQGRVREVL